MRDTLILESVQCVPSIMPSFVFNVLGNSFFAACSFIARSRIHFSEWNDLCMYIMCRHIWSQLYTWFLFFVIIISSFLYICIVLKSSYSIRNDLTLFLLQFFLLSASDFAKNECLYSSSPSEFACCCRDVSNVAEDDM